MSPADTAPFPIGRYADAALRCLDEVAADLAPDDHRRQAYDSARRILVRLAREVSPQPGHDELGVGIVHPPSPSLDDSGLHRAVLAEAHLLDAAVAEEEERLRQTSSVAPANPEELTQEVVEAAVRRAGHPDARVAAVRTVLGGRSKQTVFVDMSEPCGLPEHFVLRHDLATSSLGTSVIDEYPLLGALSAAGLPVPVPYQMVAVPNELGQPFLLMQRLPGAAEGTLLRSSPSPGRVKAAAAALGALHTLPTTPFAPLLGHTGSSTAAPSSRTVIEALWDEWRARCRSDVAVVEAAFRYLTSAGPVHDAEAVVVHGDYSFHNLLFVGDELTAVLDWELARIGSPAEDLGYIRPSLSAVGGWDAFVEHYCDAGGPAVPLGEVRFHSVLSLVRLAVLMLRSREYFETGLTSSPLKADLTMYWLPRLLQHLSREMREVIGTDTAAGVLR